MSAAALAFSGSYSEARRKFLDAAHAAGLEVESRRHPEPGRDGEELAMDVVRDGHPDARGLLLLTSGCHGVEGYCGSGVQVSALQDAAWRQRVREAGLAVLYVHALNPYGFSHIRRVTHENIDLNRNFLDFDAQLAGNPGYREIHHLLVPDQWPPDEANAAAIQNYVAERGESAFQAAITRGQHEFPHGLFFSGTRPSWSNLALREVLRSHGRRAARIAWIDVHTGLGPNGVGERIFAGRDDGASVQRARAWWAGNGKTPVTSIYDGTSSSAYLTGLMWTSACDECPQAEFTGIALEYGTLPILETLQALRAEQWLQLHPQAPAEQAAQIKRQMRDAFYTDTDAWKEKVLVQAHEALDQAVTGLSSG
jgi:hypothetical protein